MRFLDAISKGIKTITEELQKPESFHKGEKFEEYIRKYTFPQDRYKLIHKTHSYQSNKEDFVESSLQPDYKFRCLETGRDFYVLSKIAESMHGIGLSQRTLGYTFQNDLSITGVVPGADCGTLKHELFHLLSRKSFGDIPPWLDEGGAALYEVSRREQEMIIGLDNWRGGVLKEVSRPGGSDRYRAQIKGLSELVSMNWSTFDSYLERYERASDEHLPPEKTTQQAINHATARYFAYFLQEYGQHTTSTDPARRADKLKQMYLTFQDREVSEIDDPTLDAISRVETVMGMPIQQVDSEFRNWLQRKLDNTP